RNPPRRSPFQSNTENATGNLDECCAAICALMSTRPIRQSAATKSGRLFRPALHHHTHALAQRDPRRWPAQDDCPIGCLCHLEVVHASDVLNDAVPNVDAKGKAYCSNVLRHRRAPRSHHHCGCGLEGASLEDALTARWSGAWLMSHPNKLGTKN